MPGELEREHERRQLEYELEQAKHVDSEQARRQQTELERKRVEIDFRRDQEIQQMRHELEIDSMKRQMADRDREDERIRIVMEDERKEREAIRKAKEAELEAARRREADEWEDKRKREADAAKMDKLERLVKLDHDIDEQERRGKQADYDHELKKMELEGRQEIQRIEAMGRLGPHALAQMAPSDERARILADMQRSEGMRGMDAEQILAMAAEGSPAVAAALQERYRNANAEVMSSRERELYDRMLAEQKDFMDRQERSQREARMTDNSTMSKVLDALSAQSSARTNTQSQPQPQSPIFVTPAGVVHAQPVSGAAPESAAATTSKVLLCPGCRSENPSDSRFCSRCGQAIG